MKLQAVTTTGIYCRADCGARPHPQNVRPMPNAVAAMAAGFRPCLVCRPDRLPDFGMDSPPPEVAHAVRLIAEGFLDSATTDQLAKRVGYSARQLVRLFQQRIGATPDFVARTRRAHLARRLLDESNLSIINIAFASGFSSVRQMNRVMHELFGFTPTQLRAKRMRKDTLDGLDGGLRLRVPFVGPLSIPSLMSYLGARAIPEIETVENGVYKRTMNHCGYPGVVEIGFSEKANHLDVTMHLATFGSIIDQVERVRSLFGLNHNNSQAIQFLRKDKILGQLVRTHPGIRLPGAWDRFETSVRIIIGQQVSVRGASTLMGRLVERFGTAIDAPLPGSLRRMFPNACVLADAKMEGLGMPQSRAETIKRFAAAVVSGEIDLTAVAALEDVVSLLVKIPGIGSWTAHLIAARAMGVSDAFPASDLGLRRAATRLLGFTCGISGVELEELSQQWRPFRTTAAAYLWMVASDSEFINLNIKTTSNRTAKRAGTHSVNPLEAH
jgi:AraC family transcriptional regulator, regulatory protein of adaptative response / DNA-3-methyladenine glycosylase II